MFKMSDVAKRRILVATILMSLTGAGAIAQEPAGGERYWPSWSGPLNRGVALRAEPPLVWSETTNVRWKVELPGLGSATPVVWGDRVFVLTAVRTERAEQGPGFFSRIRTRIMGGQSSTHLQQFVILAIDRRDGTVLWDHVSTASIWMVHSCGQPIWVTCGSR